MSDDRLARAEAWAHHLEQRIAILENGLAIAMPTLEAFNRFAGHVTDLVSRTYDLELAEDYQTVLDDLRACIGEMAPPR